MHGMIYWKWNKTGNMSHMFLENKNKHFGKEPFSFTCSASFLWQMGIEIKRSAPSWKVWLKKVVILYKQTNLNNAKCFDLCDEIRMIFFGF